LVKLRQHLQAAREQGEAFGDAWSPTVMVALQGLRGADRREWTVALSRTRETWQRCYERRPEMKVERQLHLIGAERGEPVIERPCQTCGSEIASRHATRYCGSECRKAAWRVRRRVAA
jgi:hypothetical protein